MRTENATKWDGMRRVRCGAVRWSDCREHLTLTLARVTRSCLVTARRTQSTLHAKGRWMPSVPIYLLWNTARELVEHPTVGEGAVLTCLVAGNACNFRHHRIRDSDGIQ